MGQPSGPIADELTLFTREYGGSPEAVASAPGRVNLIGEHVDYNLARDRLAAALLRARYLDVGIPDGYIEANELLASAARKVGSL